MREKRPTANRGEKADAGDLPSSPAPTPLASIKPNARNPRTISKDAFAKLCESIKRDPQFMVLRPIVVDGEGIIIGGNMRWRACKQLGMEHLPPGWVRRADDLTPEQRKRFMLVDNAPEGMAGEWDDDILAADFDTDELTDLGFLLNGKGAPEDFPEVDESIATEHQCPKCGYKWSGSSEATE